MNIKNFTIKELVEELLSRKGVDSAMFTQNKEETITVSGDYMLIFINNYPNTDKICI